MRKILPVSLLVYFALALVGSAGAQRQDAGRLDALRRCEILADIGIPQPDTRYSHVLCIKGPDGRVPAILNGYSAVTLTGHWSIYRLNQELLAQMNDLRLDRNELGIGFRKFADDHAYDDEIDQPSSARDYTGSGFDRGHIAPSGSLAWSEASMRGSFYVTNVAPQNPRFNREAWRCLEQSIRKWADVEGDTWVIAGTAYIGEAEVVEGDLHEIRIPSHYYSIIYQPDQRRGVAIVAENKLPTDVRRMSDWDRHMPAMLMSISEAEELLDIDFGEALADSKEREIEDAAADSDEWPLVYPRPGRPAARCISRRASP